VINLVIKFKYFLKIDNINKLKFSFNNKILIIYKYFYMKYYCIINFKNRMNNKIIKNNNIIDLKFCIIIHNIEFNIFLVFL
jgi:hypothetical protein